MEFAMTTDYIAGTGCPDDYLRQIATAGWKWVHWCHHWNDDFIYSPTELRHLEQTLAELGLRMLDIHGSAGREKAWDSLREHERQAGVELVRNRIEMAARLGCRIVIMHPARLNSDPANAQRTWDCFRRSVDELLPDCRRHGVRLAMENMTDDKADSLERLMAAYEPDTVGLCYDPGHGCIAGDGLDRLTPLARRLIALHLNDNDGRGDLHQPPFMGKVDWPRLARIIASSGYDRPAMSVEVVLKNSGTQDVSEFLSRSLEGARRLDQLIKASQA